MQVQLTPYHARMIANNVDYNQNGRIDRRELSFRNGSKRLADYDRNGKVSTEELAYSLMRGDIFISQDRKAYPTYQRPGWGFGQRPTYPGYGYNRPPMPQAPGYPYQHNNNGSSGPGIGQVLGTTVVGAGIGAGIGYAISGSTPIGAAIGGAVGLISNLFFK